MDGCWRNELVGHNKLHKIWLWFRAKIVQNLNLEEGQEIEQFLRDLRHGFVRYLNLALIEIV